MTHKLKLGWKASAEQFRAAPAPRLRGVLAEELGSRAPGSATTSSRGATNRRPTRRFSIAWLAATGERTKRMTLGTSVLTPTFRYHPSVVAHAFATLGTM